MCNVFNFDFGLKCPGTLRPSSKSFSFLCSNTQCYLTPNYVNRGQYIDSLLETLKASLNIYYPFHNGMVGIGISFFSTGDIVRGTEDFQSRCFRLYQGREESLETRFKRSKLF